MMSLLNLLRNKYKLISPDWLREFILVRRRSQLFINANVVFIHIPKAAGSSINQALYGKFMGHIRAQSVIDYASKKVSGLPRFAVTRNPWDRLVSAWRFAKQGRGYGKVIAGIHSPKLYSHPAFDKFDTFVKDWLCKQQFSKLDGVFRHQVDYVQSATGNLLVDHIGSVESLHTTETWLSNLLGSTIVFPHTNRSGDPVNYRKYYDDELKELVANLYDRDISAFGYQFE